MKIALCLEYPLAQHGGVEVLVSELVRGLAAQNQVLLVSPDSPETLSQSPVTGLIAGHIPWQTDPATSERGRELAARLAAAKPDLIHFHFGGNYNWQNRAFNRCPVVHVARTGIPCLSTNHGAFSLFDGYCGEKRRGIVKLALFVPAWLSKQYVLTRLVTEVAVSRNDYRNLRRWYPLLRRKFRWIHHSRLPDSPPAPPPHREKTIVCAGTLGARKGQPLLLEAFSHIADRFPDWQLVFIGRIGHSEVLREMQDLIERHHLAAQVRILGACADEELAGWLRRSAVFAMPSVYEGLGLSLQEAQFYGCACVATRCGGVTDLITDGDNGLLVPVGQPGPLATALARLMSDEPLRQHFGKRGTHSVMEKGMTARQMVEKHEQLYAELLTPRSRD